ncbi:MAG TPA: hypothetical protein VEA44_18100, partial [Caulobacter sp.]|nr:hypothetical protein [Caulobacter sp.]
GAVALLGLLILVMWLDISRGERALVMLAVLVVGGIVYLVLRLAGVLEKPRPPAQGRFENGWFIDETPDNVGNGGGSSLFVDAILDVVDLVSGRRRRKDRR